MSIASILLRSPSFLLLTAALFIACGSRQAPPADEEFARADGPPLLPSDTMIPNTADPNFPALYAQTGGFRSGKPVSFSFSPDGSEVFFLRAGGQEFGLKLFVLDVESGEERELLSASSLQEAEGELSAEERALRERLRMIASGITSYRLSPDGQSILIPLSGKLFLYDREAGTTRELPSDGGYANDARFSPDGAYVSCVRNADLYVIDVERNRQRRLTTRAGNHITNGLAEFVAQEEMSRYRGYWWSPDSSSIVYQETNNEGVETLYTSNPIDPSQAPHGAVYPRAGTDNAQVRLGIIGVRGGSTRWVEWDREVSPYLATVKWRSGTPLVLVVQDRAQQRSKVLTVNPRSGATTVVHEETDEAWVNLDQSVPYFLDETRFLWSTERDGQWALELRTIENGQSRGRRLTSDETYYHGLLAVRSVADAEDNTKIAWISTTPEPGSVGLALVNLETGEVETLVDSGDNTATVSRDGQLWVHGQETDEGALSWNVTRGTTDREVIASIQNDVAAMPFDVNVEFVTVSAASVDRQYRAAIVRPEGFVEGASYPVIVSVYGGPGYVKVQRQARRWLREQWQANHGAIVVAIDGRGTPGRGREWERAIRLNVIDGPLEDQVLGLEALAARVPEMDLERVGIYGWSFGGYFSAMAVSRRPEVFRVGVAGAPVCAWEDYDTHYTERFMGVPSENQDGYNRTNCLTYLPNLERPLMIIHGTSDDNVYFAHALKMSDALLRAGRDHEFVVLAGSTHMVADPNLAGPLQTRIVRFLLDGVRAE